MSVSIKNNVRDCSTLPWSQIKKMERNTLKEASGRDVEKLKNAILKHGFNFPFFVWAGHDYILDGAGRVLALKKIEKEKIKIPDLPVVEIEAETIEQAKALVLQVSSQHGLISQESFEAFSADLNISGLLDSISFPDIDLGKDVSFKAFESGQDPDDIPDVPVSIHSLPEGRLNARPKASDVHPTMKPVELVSYLLGNNSKSGEKVLDTFGGSGTTMVAAHEKGRIAYLCEFSPHCCDVIVNRMRTLFPGIPVTRNGEPF